MKQFRNNQRETEDLNIDITADNGFVVTLILKFLQDDSDGYAIHMKTNGNTIVLSCVNFNDLGTGLRKPVSIAQIDGKGLYITFWSYLEGKEGNKVRSVKYTLFYEK